MTTFHVRDRANHPEIEGTLVILDVDLTATHPGVWSLAETRLDRLCPDWREMSPHSLREWCWDHRDICVQSRPDEIDLYTAGNWIDRGEWVHCNNCHTNVGTVADWAEHYATECEGR